MARSAINSRQLERVRYWQGQMLRSGDFHRQLATDAQLRAWHNRSLHSAYGVTLGLQASAIPPTGAVTGVKVQPGAAYDCFGRVIILATDRIIPVPTTTGESSPPMVLFVRYREALEFKNPRDTEGACITCGPGVSSETLDFVWRPDALGAPSDGVPLARITYDGGKPVFDSSFAPPGPRPLAKPYLAQGSTIPGSTAWQPWQVGTPGNEFSIGLQTTVDTSSAGFTQTPCYFAWLEGTNAWFATLKQPFPLFTNISGALPGQFTFNIFVAFQEFAAFARQTLKWPMYVCWLGCQPQGDWSLCLEPVKSKPCCS